MKMNQDNRKDVAPGFDAKNQSPSARLLSAALRIPLEKYVSDHIARRWIVKNFTDRIDFASHGCAILSDGSYPVFAKLTDAANGFDQFEVEMSGLSYLSAHSGVLTPVRIGNVPLEGVTVMLHEAAQPLERTPRQWREIGHALARIHRVKGERFGFEKQGYFGPLYQDNRPMDTWLDFYIQRRIWPRFTGAIDSGNLPTSVIRMVEQWITRLPHLSIPDTLPSLLHGDAQQNNFISTAAGAMIIDPAVYYGHPEMDLAYVDFFQPVPDDLLAGYQEELPIAPGFAERRDLWRISAYLALVDVGGADYLPTLVRALQKYL